MRFRQPDRRPMALAAVASFIMSAAAYGQLGGPGGGVGGVVINANGVLRAAGKNARAGKSRVPDLPEALKKTAELRRVSLRQLADRLETREKDGAELPPEVAWLAGLTRIRYLATDPKTEDVYLVGPGEAWRIDADGRAVGTKSGRPLLHVDDLVVAFRSLFHGPGTMTVSIDPTREGLAAVQNFVAGREIPRTRPDSERFRELLSEEFSLQTIRTGGVPEGSRFALAMIDADYRMKRLALGFEKFPSLPNHLDAVAGQPADATPILARWWFTPSYTGISQSEDGHVFALEGPGVKLQNEAQLLDASGRRTPTGKPGSGDAFAQAFTKKFGQIEDKYEAFADLHNLFDMTVFVGLIRQRHLAPWIEQSAFLDQGKYQPATGSQPKQAEPVVTVRLTTTARAFKFIYSYGGVALNPMEVLQQNAVRVAPSDTDPAGSGTLMPRKVEKLLLSVPAVTQPGEAKALWVDLPAEAAREN